jgi:kynurenine formamidase
MTAESNADTWRRDGVWPTYAQLRARTDAPPGSSWGLFPDRPQLGMANFISAEAVARAAESVSEGAVFNLDYALDLFDPPLPDGRGAYEHTIFDINTTAKDDYLDGFYLQASSQVDGLRHVRDFRYGHYQGVERESLVPSSPDLGIQLWAERPVVGRAVLVDLELAAERAGSPIDHHAGQALDFELLDEALTSQGTALEPGDVVLLNTGWSAWYLELDDAARAEVRERALYTGLYPDMRVLAWLWDNKLSFLGSDTVSVEVFPAPPDPPLLSDSIENKGRLHGQLLARLGILLGELWKLDELTEHSRRTGKWVSFITVKPLNLPGGVGSPPNATAIR